MESMTIVKRPDILGKALCVRPGRPRELFRVYVKNARHRYAFGQSVNVVKDGELERYKEV
jgi:hypothetical protein